MHLNSLRKEKKDKNISSPSETLHNHSFRRYRFWPVYAAAFTRTFGFSIFGIALPNYLIYIKKFPPTLIGYVISSFALAYIIGPFVGDWAAKKIGVRTAVWISTIISSICMSVQIFAADPLFLIFARIIDGIALGFFWPNLQLQVVVWQNGSPKEYHDIYFRKYTSSWNGGLLLGEISGFFMVLIINSDFIALVVGWLIVSCLIVITWFIELENNKLYFDTKEKKAYAIPHEIFITLPQAYDYSGEALPSGKDTDNVDTTTRETLEITKYPVILVIASGLIFSTLKSTLNFAYPIYLEQNSIDSYWVYITIFFQQSVQILSINFISHRSLKIKFFLFIFGIGCAFVMFLLLWLYLNLFLYVLLMLVGGLLVGMIYTFGTQLMFAYGTKTGKSLFTSGYEVLIGMGFGISPLVLGFLVDREIPLGFLYGVLFMGIWFIFLILYLSLFWKKEKKT